jgi:hypothetical protein
MKKSSSQKGLITGVIGLISFVLAFFFAAAVIGDPDWFINEPVMLAVLFLSVAYGLIYCKHGFNLVKISKGIKTGALYAGGICFILSVIMIFYMAIENPDALGYNLTYAWVSLLYGLLLNAVARIAEVWFTPPDEDK